MRNPELCKHADSLIVQRNYGYRWVTCTECHTDFFPEHDSVAVVRRGVESGTIKGEVVEFNDSHMNEPIRYYFGPGSYLVILVSDGGSET